MYMANMQDGSTSALPLKDVERLIFVLQGSISLSVETGTTHSLLVDSYAYLPANIKHSMISDESTTLVIFERRYTATEDPPPDLIVGSTDKQPLLETPGEVQLALSLSIIIYYLKIGFLPFRRSVFHTMHIRRHELLSKKCFLTLESGCSNLAALTDSFLSSFGSYFQP
jgi:glyoxylate utilization-related uncharacterized protein